MSLGSVEGVAHLCFVADGSCFRGIFISAARNQYTLLGRPAHKDDHVDTHKCCFDEDSTLMDLVVVDHSNLDEEYVIHGIMKSGGDNCSLTSDHVRFYTDELLVGQKAEDSIKKYFSKTLLDQDCFVCIGKMELDYTALPVKCVRSKSD